MKFQGLNNGVYSVFVSAGTHSVFFVISLWQGGWIVTEQLDVFSPCPHSYGSLITVLTSKCNRYDE